ncbi:MAG: 50S ribosomal protein L11 methyltransferase, partial [Candidatus Omnitrophota bacterium]
MKGRPAPEEGSEIEIPYYGSRFGDDVARRADAVVFNWLHIEPPEHMVDLIREVVHNTSYRGGFGDFNLKTYVYWPDAKDKGDYYFRVSIVQDNMSDANWERIKKIEKKTQENGLKYLIDSKARDKDDTKRGRGAGFIHTYYLANETGVYLEYNKLDKGLETDLWIKLDVPSETTETKPTGNTTTETTVSGSSTQPTKNISARKKDNTRATLTLPYEPLATANPDPVQDKLLTSDEVEDILLKSFCSQFPGDERFIRDGFVRGDVSIGNKTYKYLYRNYSNYFLHGYHPAMIKWGIEEPFYRAGDVFVIDIRQKNLIPEEIKNSTAKLIYLDFSKDHPAYDLKISYSASQRANSSHYRHQTILHLIAMQELDLKGKIIVDAGAGNGIAGILALTLGASKVYALDEIKDFKQFIKQNAELNNIPKQNLDFTFFGESFDDLAKTKKSIKSDIALLNTEAWGLASYNEFGDILSISQPDKVVLSGGAYHMPETKEAVENELKNKDFKIISAIEAQINPSEDDYTYASLIVGKSDPVVEPTQPTKYMESKNKGIGAELDGITLNEGKSNDIIARDIYQDKNTSQESICTIHKIEGKKNMEEIAKDWKGHIFPASQWKYMIDKHPNGFIMALRSDEGEIIGMAFVDNESDGSSSGNNSYYIYLIEVLKSYRADYRGIADDSEDSGSQGAGRFIVQRIAKEALADLNVGDIVLRSEPTVASDGFWKKLGAEPIYESYGVGNSRPQYRVFYREQAEELVNSPTE